MSLLRCRVFISQIVDKTLSLPYPIFFSTKRASDFRLEHTPVLYLPGTLEANTFNCGYTIMKKGP